HARTPAERLVELDRQEQLTLARAGSVEEDQGARTAGRPASPRTRAPRSRGWWELRGRGRLPLDLRGAPDPLRFDGLLVGSSLRPVSLPAAGGRRCSSRASRLTDAPGRPLSGEGRTAPRRSGAPRH